MTLALPVEAFAWLQSLRLEDDVGQPLFAMSQYDRWLCSKLGVAFPITPTTLTADDPIARAIDEHELSHDGYAALMQLPPDVPSRWPF